MSGAGCREHAVHTRASTAVCEVGPVVVIKLLKLCYHGNKANKVRAGGRRRIARSARSRLLNAVARHAWRTRIWNGGAGAGRGARAGGGLGGGLAVRK